MKKLNQQGFHLLYILLIILVFVIVGAVGYRVYQSQSGSGSSSRKKQSQAINQSDPFVQQYGNNCEDTPTVTFTNSPLATDQVGWIEPMGKVLDGHVTPTDHVYVAPTNPDAADNSYNVVMPADGKIVEISKMPAQYIGDNKSNKTAPEDHRIVVSYNCRYYSIFIHVHQLADKLKNEVTGLQPNQSKQVAIPLQAGDVIGKIGGNPVDWTMVDLKTNLNFITPKLYETEPWKIHAIDPFSVYIGSVKQQMEAKSLRSDKPIGGKIDFDRKGTLIGNWFRSGTNGYRGASPDRYYDGHLAVVPNHIDPDTIMVSIGNWQGSAAQFMVKGEVNPALVTKKNSPVKYELISVGYITPEGATWTGKSFVRGLKGSQQGKTLGTIMFEVQDDNKLRVEKFPGKSADQVTAFTANAENYER